MSDLYGVIGNPIGQSKSPIIHRAFAEQTGQDIEYRAFEGKLENFAADVDALRARGLRGLNVTAPFKLDAFRYANRLQEGARLAGAVNCLTFDGDDILGANFDGVGLVRDIQVNLGFPIKGRRILILGAGGATRGALAPLLEQQPDELVVANRTFAKAMKLVEEFSGCGELAATDYPLLGRERGAGYDIVLNATSSTLFGEAPQIGPNVFAKGCLAYDLSYGKGLCPFLRLARESGGAHLADGVGMLVEQAAEAFELWRGQRPQTRAIIDKITTPLI